MQGRGLWWMYGWGGLAGGLAGVGGHAGVWGRVRRGAGQRDGFNGRGHGRLRYSSYASEPRSATTRQRYGRTDVGQHLIVSAPVEHAATRQQLRRRNSPAGRAHVASLEDPPWPGQERLVIPATSSLRSTLAQQGLHPRRLTTPASPTPGAQTIALALTTTAGDSADANWNVTSKTLGASAALGHFEGPWSFDIDGSTRYAYTRQTDPLTFDVGVSLGYAFDVPFSETVVEGTGGRRLGTLVGTVPEPILTA